MYVLIDGNGILCRYIFAIKEEMYDSDGLMVSGVYGFCRMLLRIIKEDIQGIYIAFDQCRNNFRKLIDPTYKLNRPKYDKNIWGQVDRMIEFCKLVNIPFGASDVYEGDDIINSIVMQNPKEQFKIIAIDKDFFQLIDERVQLFHPFKREFICENTILQKYGIPPRKFELFLSLCGDSADNIKGIKGIGPKTAAKILTTVENVEELKIVLPQHADALEIMYSLVKLNHEVFINPPLQKLSIDKVEMRRFLQYMNFTSLMHLV